MSEFIEFGYKNSLIKHSKLENLKEEIQKNKILIDETEKITRTNFENAKYGDLEFLKSSVSYPLLIYKFNTNDILCEIIIREKQFAVGSMPMLYFCIALGAIYDKDNKQSFLNRTIKSNENGF